MDPVIIVAAMLGAGLAVAAAVRVSQAVRVPALPPAWHGPLRSLEEKLRAAGVVVHQTQQSADGARLRVALGLAAPPPGIVREAQPIDDLLAGADGALGKALVRVTAHGGAHVERGNVLAVHLDRVAVGAWQPDDIARCVDDLRALVAGVDLVQGGGTVAHPSSALTSPAPDGEGAPSGAPLAVPTLRESEQRVEVRRAVNVPVPDKGVEP